MAVSLKNRMFRQRNASVKKSLSFDLSPGSEKNNPANGNISIDSKACTPSPRLEKIFKDNTNSSDSSPSNIMIASCESIDENQNQTPQQNQKFVRISNDITPDAKKKSKSLGSASLLRSSLRERIDKIIDIVGTPDLVLQKCDNSRLKTRNYDIVASTPRNLFHEFGRNDGDRVHTPKHFCPIPENMSTIKKIHGKEKSYNQEGPVRNENSHLDMTTDSLEIDDSSNICINTSSNIIATNQSQQGNITSQNSSGAVTPEQNMNIADCILTESIKMSHKKIKHRKAFPSKNLFPDLSRSLSPEDSLLHHEMGLGKLDTSAQDIQDNSDNQHEVIENKSENATCSSQNSNRPSTPENVNSSRLLLSEVSFVEKSHKADKRRSNVKHFNKCREYSQRTVSMLQNSRYEKENTSKSLCNKKSFQLKDSSLDVSPKKKTKLMNVSLQSDVHMSRSSSLQSEDTDNEFKIYSPIRRKTSILLSTMKCVCADKVSPEKDEAGQTASKELDFSRCATPVAHCSYLSNINREESEDLTYGRWVNAQKDINDVSDNKPTNTADSTDKDGRSTPKNMSTMELLCNRDSIKKSYKKDKRDTCRRQILAKESKHIEKIENVNFADSTQILEQHAILPLKPSPNVDTGSVNTETCSNICNEKRLQTDSTEHKTNGEELKSLIITPPNNSSTIKFLKRLQTTSIKKSHKKERNRNAHAKYIFMSDEYDVSDDGSIFDEDDRLISTESSSLFQ